MATTRTADWAVLCFKFMDQRKQSTWAYVFDALWPSRVGSPISFCTFRSRDPFDINRLAEVRLAYRQVLNADPELKLVSARSRYMRDEGE